MRWVVVVSAILRDPGLAPGVSHSPGADTDPGREPGSPAASCLSLTSQHRAVRPEPGTLTLPQRTVETPVFMPVGTQGACGRFPRTTSAPPGATLVLAEYVPPARAARRQVVEKLGALHRFMGWDRPASSRLRWLQVFRSRGRPAWTRTVWSSRVTWTAAAARSPPSAPRRSSGRSAPTSRWPSITWCPGERMNQLPVTPSSER